MEHPYPVIEFETEVGPEGVIRLPSHVRQQIPDGRRIVVRLTPGALGSLRERGVTEGEIEEISLMQYEARENVMAFLGAEGGLSGDQEFNRRAQELFGTTGV